MPAVFFIWFATTGFVLFQFFLQLSSGVLVGSLMHDFRLTPLQAALLTSSFYYMYTGLQITVGVLFDRFQAKAVLSVSCALCAAGCLIFSHATSLSLALLGRLAMGGGAAFAFVGLLAIIRLQFAAKRCALMVGVSEAIGLIGSMIGSITLAAIKDTLGWRQSLFTAGFIGLFLAYLLWRIIPLEDKQSHQQPRMPIRGALWRIVKMPLAWLNGYYIGILFSVITVYAALWGTPFLEVKLHIDLTLASTLNSLVFLGAAIGCPLFGFSSNRLVKRKTLMRLSSFGSAALLSFIIYLPAEYLSLHIICLFCLGLVSGSYMLSFSISDELSPCNMQNTVAGFTNTLSVITAPLLQPLIGHFLVISPASGEFTTATFQHGLLILPILLVIAGLVVKLLPGGEATSMPKEQTGMRHLLDQSAHN